MKPKHWPDYVIALTVIACSLVLLAAMTFALYGFRLSKGGRELEIEFQDSTGIKLHSSVRYAGAPAGTVIRMRYLTPAERQQSKNPKNAVRVTVRLDDEAPVISSDVMAGLSAETILGEKFIALSAGSLDAPPLPDGAIIQGKEVVAFDTLARSVQSALDHVNNLAGAFNRDYAALIPKVTTLLSQVNGLLDQGSNFVRNADGAIISAGGIVSDFKTDYAALVDKIDTLLAQVTTLATNADTAIVQAGSFIGRVDGLVKSKESEMQRIIDELRVVSQNLKVTTTYTKALTGTLGERPSRLLWGRKKTPLPTEAEILASTNAIPIEFPKE